MDVVELSIAVDSYLTQRQIASKFNVSQCTVRYWLSKFNLKTRRFPDCFCRVCRLFKERQDFYTLRNRASTYCKKCANNLTAVRGRQNKQRGVDYLGGKCITCGYSKSLGALHFHHRDPELKDINYYRARLWSWERYKIELDKCDLLCSNCHAEKHEEIQSCRPFYSRVAQQQSPGLIPRKP